MKRGARIFLARHGQTVGYEGGVACGFTDTPLSPTGITQMERLAEKLRSADIKAVYSSDLQRTYLGAKIVAKDHDTQALQVPELRELNLGSWEGLDFTDIQEKLLGATKKGDSGFLSYQTPGGEIVFDFVKRVVECLDSIINENHGGNVFIVAHAGVNRVILCHLLGIDFSNMFRIGQECGCLNIIDIFPDNFRIIKLLNG
jgi:broad specificity phosphatase PhoE